MPDKKWFGKQPPSFKIDPQREDAIRSTPSLFLSAQHSLSIETHQVTIDGKKYQKEPEPFAAGGHGIVFKGKDPATGKKVVFKQISNTEINIAPAREENRARNMKHEFEMLRTLDHPNINKYIDGFCSFNMALFVLEQASHDLFSLLRKEKFTEKRSLEVARDIAAALIYLHGQGIIHGDIKPENILMKGETATLSDFGHSIKRLIFFGRCGTQPYMAPEMLTEDPYYTSAVDIWALALVLYLCATGGERLLWRNNISREIQYQEIEKKIPHLAHFIGKYQRPKETNLHLYKILKTTLVIEQHQRDSAQILYDKADVALKSIRPRKSS